jgi:hypothetical protein
MRTIEIRQLAKFGGAWIAFEAPGVEPAFPGPNGKQDAIQYACQRFGGSTGAIHVYEEAGENIVEKIPVDGGHQYGQRK